MKLFSFVLGWFILALGCGPEPSSRLKEAWDLPNNPLRFRFDHELSWDLLPRDGALDEKPWSDTYWPSSMGGIAARWRGYQNGFDYDPPSLDQLRHMSLAERSSLSPAEKYDAFLGRFDYPLVHLERKRTSPLRPRWEGLCHGWAVAALHFKEPNPVLVRSPLGLQIPFGAADVKALLTYVQGQIAKTKYRTVGSRCNVDLGEDPEAKNRPECRDLNAGAFHVILANEIGLKKRGFVLDLTRDLEVWNHPVSAYRTRVIGDSVIATDAAPGAVRAIAVETEVTYTIETPPMWEAPNRRDTHFELTKTYRYDLELDRRGLIVGGAWQMEDRPDFLWMRGTPEFSGDFAAVLRIYEESLRSTPLLDPAVVGTGVASPLADQPLSGAD